MPCFRQALNSDFAKSRKTAESQEPAYVSFIIFERKLRIRGGFIFVHSTAQHQAPAESESVVKEMIQTGAESTPPSRP
ncbi:hypothetical protein J0X15_06375 [Roseibium sp. CAU 1637]|uniref:Uncharacterized protein n=1 Tax=Roseibium limicola TaxID=2816037 RepID=A0A939ENX8_9HYPH|nr:hypothetical protein [Roseibium limicola]MBO0344838.1 hypothetical protein [Roseibium limicola]